MEQTTTITPQDLAAFNVTCPRCQSTASLNPLAKAPARLGCPGCDFTFWSSDAPSLEHDLANAVIAFLRDRSERSRDERKSELPIISFVVKEKASSSFTP